MLGLFGLVLASTCAERVGPITSTGRSKELRDEADALGGDGLLRL